MTEETTNNDIDLLNEYIERTKQFNIFKVLGMQKEKSENRHSNFIAWLLDSKENHGLKNLFFNEFFNGLGIEDIANCEEYTVKREESFKTDIDENEKKKGRPDIVIKDKNENVICVIEVKFGAKETNNQCKRYYENYGPMCKYIFLDLDDKCYDELENKYERDKNFDFSVYKLATFKNNILKILTSKEFSEAIQDKNVKSIIDQYSDLLKEKYYIIPEEKIEACVNILKDNKIDDYSKAPIEENTIHSVIHNFIWHTAPNKYNEILLEVIKELDLRILLKWKEDGSSLSLRCVNTKDYKENYDFHDYPHFYIDHRKNEINLHFQENINKADENKKDVKIVSSDDYLNNMLKSDDELYKNLKRKIENIYIASK